MPNLHAEVAIKPEGVWGIEALDPLAMFEWSRRLWLKINNPEGRDATLILLFRPSAEHSALQCLQWLARFGRSFPEGMAVFFYDRRRTPFLNEIPDGKTPALVLIHHATRFLDLQHLLLLGKKNPHVRIVATIPAEEKEGWPQNFDCRYEEVAAEEPAYCVRKADEIVAHFLGNMEQPPPHLDLILRTAAEAGAVGVRLPARLLADYLQIDVQSLCQRLSAAPFNAFLDISERRPPSKSEILFRGRWLAEEISPNAAKGRFPHLTALIDYIEPREHRERAFLINLLLGFWLYQSESDFEHFAGLHRELILRTLACCGRRGPDETARLYEDHPFLKKLYSLLDQT